MSDVPLISCLCISENRPFLLSRAIQLFLDQTYPNKELIVVSRIYNPEYDKIISARANKSVYYHYPNPLKVISLGDLRNLSIEKCNGKYFCVWDDDDWHHVDRLKVQFEAMAMSKKLSSISMYILLYDQLSKIAYLSNARPWEGTLLCSKDAVTVNGIKYPSLSKSEDLEFTRSLMKHNCLFPLIDPRLYIYVYHGGNTGNSTFFAHHFQKGQRLSAENSSLIHEILSNKIGNIEASRRIGSLNLLSTLNYFHEWLT